MVWVFNQRLHLLTSSDQTPHKLNSDYSAALTQLDTPNHPRLKILLASLSPGPFYYTHDYTHLQARRNNVIAY